MSNSSKADRRVVVLSIDGVGLGLIQRLIRQGLTPNLARLAEENSLSPMRSVQPTVSCVAWATYMTGRNPGKHGIYGFIDRRRDSYDISIPNGSMMGCENIWQTLSGAGKRVFGMNVCSSYPPKPVNGVLIGGFLAPSIDKVVHPATEAAYLKSIDYRIDSDPMVARQDRRAMLDDLDRTLDARAEAMFHYLDQGPWDFFHTHIMGSDRINHFLWGKQEDGDGEFAAAFDRYYGRVDDVVGRLLDKIDDDTGLLIFSDHGFCRIKYEVQLSRYLVETGWTKPAAEVKHPLSIDPAASKAYCLIPGRIYINLQGREPGGIVPLSEYERTRQALRDTLLKLRDPDTNAPVIADVVIRERLYWPSSSNDATDMAPEQVAQADGVFGRAADLIAIPHDGYDLKLGLAGDTVFQQTQLEGMHTYDDAFIIARNVELPHDDLEIMNLAPRILEAMGAAVPIDMDG